MAAVDRPRFTPGHAQRIARDHFGLHIRDISALPSDRDQNFLLEANEKRYVLKISNPGERLDVLDLQHNVLQHLRAGMGQAIFPEEIHTLAGEPMTIIDHGGNSFVMRVLSYLEGVPLVDVNPHTAEMRKLIGQTLGKMTRTLHDFSPPPVTRDFQWDLAHAPETIRQYMEYIPDDHQRRMVERLMDPFAQQVAPILSELPQSVIHNDANDHNMLIGPVDKRGTGFEPRPLVGLIDFGDLVYSCTVFELAVACAYIMLDQQEPLVAAAQVVAGFQLESPLLHKEIEVLFPSICARLCLSVTLAAYQRKLEPENEYLSVSGDSAWTLIEQLGAVDPVHASWMMRTATLQPQDEDAGTQIMVKRQKVLGHNVSVAYMKPLTILRGEGQYLFDESGQAFLDCVNNVCHVGHSHPQVLRALQAQAALLNTNTRYLHPAVIELAERLTATLPEPLQVCYFVCTGSEANELAVRLARAHTGRRDLMVLEGAYHGNTSTLVDLSPYKFRGPGGDGQADYVHTVQTPDGYRGPHKFGEPQLGRQYGGYVAKAVEEAQNDGRPIAAFLCEPLLGCGGQVVLPENFLRQAYHHVRAVGGVCIADEVQVGFGRVGTHYWGFETQGVVPDIVTLGKPFGNGHPLAAVVTTPAIATSFANGMEYFNTFGGNPVSAAVGLAVMDVIEQEGLQAHALKVGDHLKAGLLELMDRHPIIGDVRGLGLFLGVELVLDRVTLEPAPRQAAYIAERMRDHAILISIDGPLHNVLKLKPPMVFTRENADEVVGTLDQVLGEDYVRLGS